MKRLSIVTIQVTFHTHAKVVGIMRQIDALYQFVCKICYSAATATIKDMSTDMKSPPPVVGHRLDNKNIISFFSA